MAFAARYYQRAAGEVALAALPPALRDVDGVQLARRLQRKAPATAASPAETPPTLSPEQQQVLAQIEPGPVCCELPPIAPHRRGIGWVESSKGETVHWLLVGTDETVDRYRVRSATFSNWPAVPLTVPGNIVPDFPLINKSFELCYACCDR